MIIDSQALQTSGFCFLPALSQKLRSEILDDINNASQGRKYFNLEGIGDSILDKMNLSFSEMDNIHELVYGTSPDQKSRYFIARIVSPGATSESFRMHFDSHRLTIVVPINIPQCDNCGELWMFPKIRPEPKFWFTNILSKLLWKTFSTKWSIKILTIFKSPIINDFSNYQPILFLGRQTLHGNNIVSNTAESKRVSVLLHFFDPEGSLGSGSLLRILRQR